MSVYKFIRSILAIPARTPSNINQIAACACFQPRLFSAKIPTQKIVKEIDPNTKEVIKKKTSVVPKVTLLSGDSITVTTLEEAQKLSKRRDLKLVKVLDLDSKTQRPVYRLMTGAEYHAEDLKQREQRKKDRQNQYIKGEKVLLLNAKISEHDLQTQLTKAVKWATKMYEVRVVISGDSANMKPAEAIYAAFEDHFRNSGVEAKIVQKRTKDADIKFQILPPKKIDSAL